MSMMSLSVGRITPQIMKVGALPSTSYSRITLHSVPFLPVRDDFHPKRNQARQKLATLPTGRFKDLSSDVYYELARRYPEFKEEVRTTFNSLTYAPHHYRRCSLQTHPHLQYQQDLHTTTTLLLTSPATAARPKTVAKTPDTEAVPLAHLPVMGTLAASPHKTYIPALIGADHLRTRPSAAVLANPQALLAAATPRARLRAWA